MTKEMCWAYLTFLNQTYVELKLGSIHFLLRKKPRFSLKLNVLKISNFDPKTILKVVRAKRYKFS